MRKFNVKWTLGTEKHQAVVEAKSQTDAILDILYAYSSDGVHVPKAVHSIVVKPAWFSKTAFRPFFF